MKPATVKTTDFQPPTKKSIRGRGPILRFSPYAWAKLLAFRDYGPTEIAGFGIAPGSDPGSDPGSTPASDPLLIEDFITVKQSCTAVTVAMNDEAVADYFDDQVDEGRKPEQFARIWLHTHPGASAHPSSVDEETFERVFGKCDWAIMAILARGGQTYARLRFGVGPGGQMLIPVEVDFSVPFPRSEHEAWKEEYDFHVTAEHEFGLMHQLAATLMAPNGEEDLAQFHHHRLHRWHEADSWDSYELSDEEALAILEAELEQRDFTQEMEVPLDSR
jgi:proteasome lid subunit RPN8/RPN11